MLLYTRIDIKAFKNSFKFKVIRNLAYYTNKRYYKKCEKFTANTL